MNSDTAYCINKRCPKRDNCRRAINEKDITDQMWIFGGCTDNDYFYFWAKMMDANENCD